MTHNVPNFYSVPLKYLLNDSIFFFLWSVPLRPDEEFVDTKVICKCHQNNFISLVKIGTIIYSLDNFLLSNFNEHLTYNLRNNMQVHA